MAIQTSITRRNYFRDREETRNPHNHVNAYDEEIEETEDDLIENYLYLTNHCGVLRHSPTTSALDTFQQQQQQHINQSSLSRQFSWATENPHHHFERKSRSYLNDLNTHQSNYSTISRVPPTIYYNGNEDDDDRSFSLVKLFARMKARLNHDRRYRSKSTHALLREDDTPEWFELAKNIRSVLTTALLPDGGYDALFREQNTSHHRRRSSKKKARDYAPVLPQELEEEESKIRIELDDTLNTEGDEEFDQIIWEKFRRCPRGFEYRRNAICKAIDRQQFQGQLVYVYGIANNILIDENLKASGLG